MARYDEDLHENLFFNTLVSKYSSLFSEAAEKKWMIFVPRADTVPRLKLNRTDFENHVLRQTGGVDSTTLTSVNGKVCVVKGEMVTTEQGYKEQRTVRILFEENFFNSQDESYQVFCVEQPLEGALTDDAGAVVRLETLQDCCTFLWSNPGTEKVRRSVDHLLDFFPIERGGSLRATMDAASAVYTRAIQEVLKTRRYQTPSQRSFCKLAMESYVMAGLHRKIFKEICFLFALRDVSLNKITRNLMDIHPQYLGIKSQYRLSMPQAKAVLSQLNQFTTPLEKMNCLKQCVSVFTEMPMKGHNEVLTADELLPILVYLVITSDIPNWNGNIAFINNFHFSCIGREEFAYNIASFEAAVEFISSGEVTQLVNVSTSRSVKVAATPKLRSTSNATDGEDSPVAQFFKAVVEGGVDGVCSLLRLAQEEAVATKAQLCHPLCNCERCTALEERKLDDSHQVTVFSRDADGRTALHIAAKIGNLELVRVLLEQGAIVTATDHNGSTALHLACQKGHQKIVLLLLSEDSIHINAVDIHSNTSLHFACSNGHEECVKSLLFHTEQCDVNVTNAQGDTPLHNAARWGYANIVVLLLEHKASTVIHNHRMETASQCAQSRRVLELLFKAKRRTASETGKTQCMKVKRIQPKRRSESLSETDRHLKKLFSAIRDNDINYVCYLFGWTEGTSGTDSEQLCHPLCQCDECIKLRKSTVVGISLTVDCCDAAGHSLLHIAAQHGRRKIVELLLSHGADINKRTNDSLTPLHLACQYNHKDVVLILVERGAEVSPCDSQGNTPLHFTCQNGHIESAAILLIHSADVTLANKRGDTPLHSAAKWNRPMIVHELLLYGAQYSATNRNHQTPLQLTNDEEVQQYIASAMKGQIVVGAYRRPPPTNPTPEGGNIQEYPATRTGIHDYSVGKTDIWDNPVIQSSFHNYPVIRTSIQEYPVTKTGFQGNTVTQTGSQNYSAVGTSIQEYPVTKTCIPDYSVNKLGVQDYPGTRTNSQDYLVTQTGEEVRPITGTSIDDFVIITSSGGQGYPASTTAEIVRSCDYRTTCAAGRGGSRDLDTPVAMVTKQHAELGALLRAIESFDRRKTLQRASTNDRSAPLLSSSPNSTSPIPVFPGPNIAQDTPDNPAFPGPNIAQDTPDNPAFPGPNIAQDTPDNPAFPGPNIAQDTPDNPAFPGPNIAQDTPDNPAFPGPNIAQDTPDNPAFPGPNIAQDTPDNPAFPGPNIAQDTPDNPAFPGPNIAQDTPDHHQSLLASSSVGSDGEEL